MKRHKESFFPLTKPQSTAKEHTWTHTDLLTQGAVSTLRNPLNSLQHSENKTSSSAKLFATLLKPNQTKNQKTNLSVMPE